MNAEFVSQQDDVVEELPECLLDVHGISACPPVIVQSQLGQASSFQSLQVYKLTGTVDPSTESCLSAIQLSSD